MNILENKHHIMLRELESAAPEVRDSVKLCFELLSAAAAINRACATRLASYNLSEGRFVIMLTLKTREASSPLWNWRPDCRLPRERSPGCSMVCSAPR